MIVLVPVSRFRVPYDTARGRPYSPLEALVLKDVANGGSTLADLRGTFKVHERLLVEAMVTLITAGWVAVAGGPQARFVLTAAGASAAREDAEPVSVVVTAARPQTVVLERVTGQVARHADARSWHRDDLGAEAWEQSAVMPERIIRNTLDEAQVQKLLQRETGQWVRRIGQIRLLSRGRHYVAADADPETGRVRGLPPSWSEALSGKVLDAAQAKLARAPQNSDAPARRSRDRNGQPPRFVGVAEARRTAPRATAFQLRSQDILKNTPAHEAALAWAFGNARTSVAVVAPSVVDRAGYQRVVDMAASAVGRGIAVDLLVGEAPGIPASDLVAMANAAGYNADPRDGRARLRIRNPTTGSGASLLVHDAGSVLTAVIGDHEWFGPRGPSLSVRVIEPSLAADVARAVASLWTGRDWASADWSGPAERWRRLAADAEETGARVQLGRSSSDIAQAAHGELLVDDEHAGLNPGDRAVLVGGHRPDRAAGEAAMRGVTLRITGDEPSLRPFGEAGGARSNG